MRHLLAYAALYCTATALPAQNVPLRRGTIDLSIGGSSEERPDYIVQDVRGIAIDPVGRIFLADHREHRIRAFSPSGTFLFAVGRKGAGPGDLNGPCCLAFAPNGDLVVKDQDNHRYAVFSVGATGATWRHAITLPRHISYRLDARVAMDHAGRIYDLNGLPSTADGLPAGIVRELLDATPRALRSDTFPEPPSDSLRRLVIRSGAATTGYFQPFGPRSLRAFGDDGLSATATSSRYAVTLHDGTGKRIALLERALAAQPLGARERASAEQTIAGIKARWNEPIPWGVPDHLPPLFDLFFDLDGRLWVELTTPSGSPRRADLYDRTGRYLGQREWPRGVTLRSGAIRGDTAFGLMWNADDVASVVRVTFK